MKSIRKLSNVNLDEQVTIKKIECSKNIKRRILDLGLIEGTKIKPIFKSPLGDPIAYEVRGSLISLREEETSNILVI